MSGWTIEVPRPYLTANQRMHWKPRNLVTQNIKDAVIWRCRQQKVPVMGRVHVTVLVRVPDRRRRDLENLAPTVKAAIDGLVLAEIIPDDNWEHLVGPDYRVIQEGSVLSVALVVEAAES